MEKDGFTSGFESEIKKISRGIPPERFGKFERITGEIAFGISVLWANWVGVVAILFRPDATFFDFANVFTLLVGASMMFWVMVVLVGGIFINPNAYR